MQALRNNGQVWQSRVMVALLAMLVGVSLFSAAPAHASAAVQASTSRLTVTNVSSSPICYLYISPASLNSWGDDWLGNDVIASGESVWADVSGGYYDLRAKTCDGRSIQRFNVDLRSDTTWTIYTTYTSAAGPRT